MKLHSHCFSLKSYYLFHKKELTLQLIFKAKSCQVTICLQFTDPLWRRGGYTVLALSILPSVTTIFRCTFLSNHASQPLQTWYVASARGPTHCVWNSCPPVIYSLFPGSLHFSTLHLGNINKRGYTQWVKTHRFLILIFFFPDNKTLLFKHQGNIDSYSGPSNKTNYVENGVNPFTCNLYIKYLWERGLL